MLDDLQRYLARGQWTQAKKLGQQLLLLPEGILSETELGRVCCGCGRACIWLKEYHAAVRLLELAIRHSLQARDWDTLGFSRGQLGIALLALGDLPSANDAFATYYLDLPRYDAAKAMEGHVRYNNALALRRQRRTGEALCAYQMALEFFVERGKTRDAAECHQNIAWLYLLSHKAEDALPHLECAASYVDALPPDYRLEMLVCWALYHLTILEVGTAVEMALEVLQTTQEGARATHRSEAAWIAGTVAVKLRQWDVARLLAKQAQDEAIRANEPELMNQALSLWRAIKSREGESWGQDEAAN